MIKIQITFLVLIRFIIIIVFSVLFLKFNHQDFHGPIVNTDHFLYWGRTKRTVDGKVVEFNVIEQTEFLDDVSFSSFNARWVVF